MTLCNTALCNCTTLQCSAVQFMWCNVCKEQCEQNQDELTAKIIILPRVRRRRTVEQFQLLRRRRHHIVLRGTMPCTQPNI